MENLEKKSSPSIADQCLAKIRQALFRAHETDARREELLHKYIKDLEWYFKIKKYLMSTDRTGQEAMAQEYFENKDRYKELDNDYSLIGQKDDDKFEEGVFLIFIQSVKNLNLIGDIEEELSINV
jgi:hypothetical protein